MCCQIDATSEVSPIRWPQRLSQQVTMSTRTNKPRRQDLGLTPLAPRDCPEEKNVSRSRVRPVRNGHVRDSPDEVLVEKTRKCLYGFLEFANHFFLGNKVYVTRVEHYPVTPFEPQCSSHCLFTLTNKLQLRYSCFSCSGPI